MEYSKQEDNVSLTSSISGNYEDAQEEFGEYMSFSSRFDAIENKLRREIEDKFTRMTEDRFTRMTEDLNVNITNKIQEIKDEISKKRIASDSYEDINTTSPHYSYLRELGRSNSRIDAMEDKLRIMEDKFRKEVEDHYTKVTEDLSLILLNKTTQEITNQINKKLIENNGYEDIRAPSLHQSYLHELFNSISLPGLRYVASCEPTLHRLLWIFIHTVVFFISYVNIKDAYDDWQSSPIISSLALTNVKDIPFPALTICAILELREEYDQGQVYETCVKEVNDTFIWMCIEEEFKMYQVADEISPNILGGYYPEIEKWNAFEYLKYIDKVVKPVNEETLISLHGIFHEEPEVTIMEVEEKLCKCRTYNNINFRFGSPKIKDTTKSCCGNIPHHEFKTSSACTPDKILENDCKNNLFSIDGENTLELFETLLIEDTDVSGLRIFFHSPTDYPNSRDYDVYSLPAGKVLFAEKDISFYITPTLINAKNDLVQLDVSERNCLFSFEESLSHFEFYTHKNCLIDCKISCMMTVCGCVTRDILVHDSSLPICGGTKNRGCVHKMDWDMLNSSYYQPEPCSTCNCPEDCVSLTFKVRKELTDRLTSLFNKIIVRYENFQFISSYRYSAVTNPGEFIAYALGVLGVFNGFSFVLVWEVLYWLTLRLWFTIKRYPQLQSRG